MFTAPLSFMLASMLGKSRKLMAASFALGICLLWTACSDTRIDAPPTPPIVLPPASLPAPVFAPLIANWESPHVHPVDLSPDDQTLVICNTVAHRIDIFDVSSGIPQSIGSVAVGIDPVSVRMRSDSEVWVANHLSDSVSIVDISMMRVTATIHTADEPTDIVFAGSPERAFVSCSQANSILVLDPLNPHGPATEVPIDAEDPRALAVSPDGLKVYAAVFESSNATTLLAGGKVSGSVLIPNVASDPEGPYGGVNPPPNAPDNKFNPRRNFQTSTPPPVGLIIRKGEDGMWRDDNGTDWTEFVSGAKAERSGRITGWDMPDHDVAVIDSSSLAVSYVNGCMNMCMALAVQPTSGKVTVVGTDATNHIRFEPNLRGSFVRVNIAEIDDAKVRPLVIEDLNPHLDYQSSNVPQVERDRSIGDPRAIAWHPDGTRAFVVGMGSDNVIVINDGLARLGQVEVGQGPTGIVLDSIGSLAFVLNRFAGSISTIDTASLQEVARTPFFDPTPAAIREGREYLYDTHFTSGLGQASCASCHVDARIDRLAWDLGDPSASMQNFIGNCDQKGREPCESYHPMKGPMLTQTMQDIIGKEPFHWRGDRLGIEAFSPAFEALLGDDEPLSSEDMALLKAFLATIRFPPNPFRNLDNSLPIDISFGDRKGLDGVTPLPNGDAVQGMIQFQTGCTKCHMFPSGLGSGFLGGKQFPLGPNGEKHHLVTTLFGFSNLIMKIPQLRNIHERLGLEYATTNSSAGFGIGHDGQLDSPLRLGTDPATAHHLLAFLLCFSGSDLPGVLPGAADSFDSHAAVGQQVVMGLSGDQVLLDQFLSFAAAGKVELIAKGQGRGWVYDMGSDLFLSDRNEESVSKSELRSLADNDMKIIYTVVPTGEGRRLGIDCDLDGFGDRTELDFNSDPEDATQVPQ